VKDIHSLQERAKELKCLYAIDSIVSDRSQNPGSVFLKVLNELPLGWQCPDETGARITYLGRSYVGPGFESDHQIASEHIQVWGTGVGKLDLSVRNEHGSMPEEQELLGRVVRRLGEYLEWKHTELLGERTPASAAHWTWRQRFAEALADQLDPERFGVSRVYLGGSTARGDARHHSDIDLYIEFHGTELQRTELSAWIEGWSLCLAQVALQQTGESFPGGIVNIQWLQGEPDVWQRAEFIELTQFKPPTS